MAPYSILTKLCFISLADTSASFWAKEPLWPGMYHITVEVIDAQGTTCPDRQKVELLVCTCEEGGGGGCGLKAAQQTSSSFNVGMSAIGLMILGLALLLCKYIHPHSYTHTPIYTHTNTHILATQLTCDFQNRTTGTYLICL